MTVNAQGTDLRPLSPLQGFVNAERQEAVALVEMLEQQLQPVPRHL